MNAASIQISDKIPDPCFILGALCAGRLANHDRTDLNYGLRWEAEFPRRVSDNKMNSFDPIAHQSGFRNARRGDIRRNQWRSASGHSHRQEQLRAALGICLPNSRHRRHASSAAAGASSSVRPSATPSANRGFLGFSTSASYVGGSGGPCRARSDCANGFPAVARPCTHCRFGAVPLGKRPNTAVSFFNPEQVAPASYQYNLNLQRELTIEPARRNRLHRKCQPSSDGETISA